MPCRWLTGSLVAAACIMQLVVLPGPAASQTIPAEADSYSRNELVCAFNPRCGAERVLIRRRGLTISDPDSPPAHAAPPFFTSITFEFNSAALTPQARATLDRIGDALRDPSIEAVRFRVEGHTDAKGSDSYNQALSERRANAVRGYLIEHFGISNARLVAIGFGKMQPLPNPPAESPFSSLNRRVQFNWLPPQG